MTKSIIAALLILIMTISLYSYGQPESRHEKIDAIFSQWDTPGSPGCAVGIYHNDEIVFQRGYGFADLENQEPIMPESVFYVGSVSKQFTAAAIAILVDRGDISLDDDVRIFIPELPEYDRPIPVKSLIYHTSGLRDLYALMTIADIDVAGEISTPEFLDVIKRQSDLHFLPGDEHVYSNSGYTLMAILVERVTGKSLREFTRQNIFEPLGMTNTHFHDNRNEMIRNRVLSYQPGEDSGYNLSYLENFEGVGPGGLYTTIGDLFLWDQNFYHNRLEQAPHLLDIMHTRGVLTNGDTLDYAFGLDFNTYHGLELIGHSGAFMGFRAHFNRIPAHNFSNVILCNLGTIDPAGLSRNIIDIYFEELIGGYLYDYTGNFSNPDFDVSCNLIIEEGKLIIKDHSILEGPLRYSGKDTFTRSGWEIRFIRDDRNGVEGFMLGTARARDVYFVKE
jgi:CubicO group peptidase (beta-lactamase class C family)